MKLLSTKNILSVILLVGVVFSLVRIIRSAPIDPGHPWSEIGDNPSDALPASRGGTGQTSLTANSVLLGNDAAAIQLVAPGTAGNILTSDGTTWSSQDFHGLVLLYSDETNSAETGTSVAEATLKSWAMNVTNTNYAYYILEAEVMANDARATNSNVQYNWNFKVGTTLKKSIVWRAISSNAGNLNNGSRYAATIKTIIDNTMANGSTLVLNGQMNLSNASVTMMAESFRVYGVK